jgi:hypothetical protein
MLSDPLNNEPELLKAWFFIFLGVKAYATNVTAAVPAALLAAAAVPLTGAISLGIAGSLSVSVPSTPASLPVL